MRETLDTPQRTRQSRPRRMDKPRRQPPESDSSVRDPSDAPGHPHRVSLWAKICDFVGQQWTQIDRDYIQQSPKPWDRDAQKLAIGIVLIALCLALQRYHGSVSAGMEWATWFSPEQPWNPSEHRFAGRMYWAGFKIICYILLPVLYIRYILHEKVRDHGFRFHSSRRTNQLYVLLVFGSVLMTYLASFSPEFAHRYPIFRVAHESPLYFWTWELAYGFQFVCLEFFFRGFILFTLARRYGALAIFIAILPYSMIHYTKPFLETIGSIAGGIILGTLALRTRSIYGGAIAHIAVGWSMDVFALWRKGQLWHVLGMGG